MDNAYTSGFDYDTLREPAEMASYVLHVHDEYAIEPKRPRWVLIFLMVSALVLTLLWYSLRFMPAFDIDRIEFSVSGGFTSVPEHAVKIANEFIGSSLMSNAPATLERSLKSIGVVKSVTVRRRPLSTVSVRLDIHEPNLFIASVDEQQQVLGIHLVNDGRLVPISTGDFERFGKRVFVVEVSPSYAKHLSRYGIDNGMREVVSLASEMGMDEDGRYRIVGRIRYEESLAKGFGHMVLELPAYHSTLNIRQPISESRLHETLRLIKLEHESAATRNIALIEQLRYDLYAQSLVRRR